MSVKRIFGAGVFAVGAGVLLAACGGVDDGLIIEEGTPEHFFDEPGYERTKQPLSQIL